MPIRKGFALLVPAASALVLASIPVRFDPTAAHGLQWILAAAEKGGSGGSGGNSGGSGGGSGGSGNDSGGSSSGSGSGSGGNGGGSANSGSGSGGSGSSGSRSSGGRGAGGGSPAGAASSASRGSDSRSGRSGGGDRAQARVEVRDSGIQVITGDGFRQKIENGRFELKDPMGRTVVRRSATAKDRARLFGYLR